MREFAISSLGRKRVRQHAESKDSVSIWFVRQALAGLRRHGRDPAAALQAAGIPPGLVAVDAARVSAASFGALWLAIAAELDDELFGMDRRRLKVGSFALLSRVMARGADLAAALQLAAGLLNVCIDDARVELQVGAGIASVVVAERDPGGAPRPAAFAVFAHETLLMMLHGLMCWLVGRRIRLQAAHFAHAEPLWSPEYRAMFTSRLEFSMPDSRLVFDARVLEAVPARREEDIRQFLRRAPHNFIVKFRDRNGCSARIRRRLRHTPPDRWPDLAQLAAEMQIGLSTLHRRLDQEGTSFREIKDRLRRDLAIDLLTHSGLRVAEIAATLGFAEPSAFHRAFKLWTGARPGDYRQRAVAAATHERV